MIDDGMMMPREAAAYLRVGKSTLHDWVKHHGLRAFRTPGGDTRYRKEWLDEFIEARSQTTRPAGRPRKGV